MNIYIEPNVVFTFCNSLQCRHSLIMTLSAIHFLCLSLRLNICCKKNPVLQTGGVEFQQHLPDREVLLKVALWEM